MREIEIDLVLTADAIAFEADLEDLARGDVARNEVAVGRIFLFEEVPALDFPESMMAVDCRLSCRGTQTRPPSPRADSDIRRSLSSPGIDVG